MRGICFFKFVDALVMHYVPTDDFCKVKTVYKISINFSKYDSFLFWSLYIISIHAMTA
jgi:hypothetical protein